MSRVNNNVFNQEKSASMITIVIDGKPTRMTYDAYKKWKSAKTRAKNCGKKKSIRVQQTEIKLLPNHITRLIKGIKVMKSLSAYYDNGYRQWGTIAREIINTPMISAPFIHFRTISYEIANLQNQIKEIAKHNEKDVFQFVEKLSYKMDDARHWMDELVKGVNDSRVCEFFADKECINGEGRRLGLRTLMMRTLFSLNDIDNVFKELNVISHNGLDALDYEGISGKRLTDGNLN